MKRVSIILLYLIFSKTLLSQQVKVTRDVGFWGGVNIEKTISKEFKINLEQQVRLYTNATKFDEYIIDFGGKYTINKKFKLGADLRYSYDAKRWEDPENNFRYNLDLKFKQKLISKFKMYYRLRYQHEYNNLLSEDLSSNLSKSGIRNKVKIQYAANKKNELYFSVELFKLIQIFREPYFNKIRFYIGDNVNSERGRFNYSLGYEQEINTNDPLSFFFLKTIYTLKL